MHAMVSNAPVVPCGTSTADQSVLKGAGDPEARTTRGSWVPCATQARVDLPTRAMPILRAREVCEVSSSDPPQEV
jgi:hypothetical protein